jgi:hypothetical protein
VPSPASGSGSFVGVDVDVVGDGEPLAGPLAGGDVLVVADAEEDVLVDGADCVGVEDFRALVVGLAERVA